MNLRFFFFNDTATTEIYTLSLHDALPISKSSGESATKRCVPSIKPVPSIPVEVLTTGTPAWRASIVFSLIPAPDRKSTRLNSSHSQISYAVFCLKKKIQHHKMSSFLETTR